MSYRETKRRCPGCSSPTEKLSAGDEVIDRCTQCGGIFLDYFDGEPVALTKSIPAGKVSTTQNIPLALELRDWLLNEFMKDNNGYDLSKDSIAVQRVDEAVSKALHAFKSTGQRKKINIPFIAATGDGPMHLFVDLADKLGPREAGRSIDVLCADCQTAMELTAYLGDGPLVHRCGACMSLFATPMQWAELAGYEPTQEKVKKSPWWSRLKEILLGHNES